jgi:hypothetical protein
MKVSSKTLAVVSLIVTVPSLLGLAGVPWLILSPVPKRRFL